MEHRLEIDPILRRYCEDWSSPEREGLKQIERKTHLTMVKRLDASDTIQGRILSFISKIIAPHLIVEIGTFTAYATGCLAEGLQKGGKIITIESDLQLEHRIQDNLSLLNLTEQVELILGDARQHLREIEQPIDLLFIDAAKYEYSDYYDLSIEQIRSGGVIIADNVLWKGRVLHSAKDKMTKAMHQFNKKIAEDPRVEVVILPYRDGISFIRKK